MTWRPAEGREALELQLDARAPAPAHTVLVRAWTTAPTRAAAATSRVQPEGTDVRRTTGPGGPLLVLVLRNPFGRYYAEILRAEGLNLFRVEDAGAP